MKQSYMNFTHEKLNNAPVGVPIYTRQIADMIATKYGLPKKEASAATAVAIKRIIDGNIMPDLRCYQKGIYYRTANTPFGETGINKELLIADKYLKPDIGYETGPTILHRLGLTSQMPRERILATNVAKNCIRADKKLGVMIRPPKTTITGKNKDYLQLLDVLELLDKSPVDEERPYEILFEYIQKRNLRYQILLGIADEYYNRNTVLQLAHTANSGGHTI